ncbi:hypothetical protein, partial [Bacteroides congonensis]|uniref:hypothetical protein n=1 Tax=Bacteroides congonensis TaxID=1871006 RepID=UPI00321B88B1
ACCFKDKTCQDSHHNRHKTNYGYPNPKSFISQFHRLPPFLLISQRMPPQNSTFAQTNRILVGILGESKQNIRLNMNKNMTTDEAMNLPI